MKTEYKNTKYADVEERDMQTQASTEALKERCARAMAGLAEVLADILRPAHAA